MNASRVELMGALELATNKREVEVGQRGDFPSPGPIHHLRTPWTVGLQLCRFALGLIVLQLIENL